MRSACSFTHGTMCFAIGLWLTLSPGTLVAACESMLGCRNALSGTPLLGIALLAIGAAHIHAGLVSVQAAAGMLCSESVVLLACVHASWADAKHVPILQSTAAISALFLTWAMLERIRITKKTDTRPVVTLVARENAAEKRSWPRPAIESHK